MTYIAQYISYYTQHKHNINITYRNINNIKITNKGNIHNLFFAAYKKKIIFAVVVHFDSI